MEGSWEVRGRVGGERKENSKGWWEHIFYAIFISFPFFGVECTKLAVAWCDTLGYG